MDMRSESGQKILKGIAERKLADFLGQQVKVYDGDVHEHVANGSLGIDYERECFVVGDYGIDLLKVDDVFRNCEGTVTIWIEEFKGV